MGHESSSRSLLEGAAQEVDLDSLETFKLLKNEGRLAILLALWESYDPLKTQEPLSFSELADRIPYDSPGNLDYHLEKLAGRYIQKTDDGYLLSATGMKVIRAIRAGALTQNVEFGPFSIDAFCPYCEGTTEVSYTDNYIVTRCTECPGTFYEDAISARELHPEESKGVITRQTYPPAGVLDRDAESTIQAHLTRATYQGFMMLSDVCPECANRTHVGTEICPDHEDSNQVCESCGWPYVASTWMVCQHCKFHIGAPTRWLPLRDPRVSAFFQERGMDVTSGFSIALWSPIHRAKEHVCSSDPVKIEYQYHLNGDQLSATIREDMTVTHVKENPS